MKYYANFTTSNGYTMGKPIYGNNIKSLLKDIRAIAIGNCQKGNSVTYYVADSRTGQELEARMIDNQGITHIKEIC